MKNPWGVDSYSGPWNDNDSRWTSSYKSQVPYVNSDDGFFFMDVTDFTSVYYYFTINYLRDNFRSNYYEKTNDDGNMKAYTFTLKR